MLTGEQLERLHEQLTELTGPRRLLTAAEAAELLNVPVSFVRQETRAERIPYVSIGARYRRYCAEDLEAWWQAQARGPRVTRRAA